MSSTNPKMNNKPTKSQIASKIPTSGRDSGTHSRSSSVSNLTTASDIHSEIGDTASENVEDFKVEERIWVNGTKPGCIKFLGKTQFAPGVWAGVLLDEPVGKNDGTVNGVKYFTCEPLHGIFARPNKLTRTAGAVSGVGDSSLVGFITPKSSRNAIPSSGASVCSNVSSVSTKFLSKLKPGERITVSSLGGLKPGTLRFIGETDFAKGEWAGIELDEPTGKNDGSVAGKRYFTCPMKYGLFAPLHKVSRARTTPSSASIRGTPLIRSTSRDSLNSSISNSSRASRVKLGITSLTTAQKARASGGGVTTVSKALQDALKEKVQHIEELLKERDLDRAEFARVSKHFEEMQAKSSELEKKQKKTETDRKGLEEQLSAVQRRLEDIQFQLEEEKIAKSDFEVVQTVETVQLQQRSQILKRIESFISEECGGKFLNIKEILSGKETLSDVSEKQNTSSETENLEKKIVELEFYVQQLSQEKMDIFNQLTELKKSSGDSFKQDENIVITLNTTIQEKEEMIAHLKNELNNNIEKVTQLIEDNRNLSEQIFLKEKQAKGEADDVIKELGKKIKSLTEELDNKSSQLNEYIKSIQEKESKISSLEKSLSAQAVNLTQLQVDLDNISSLFKQNKSELEDKIVAQKSLEETITSLKTQVESNTDEKQKKMILLSEEIKIKSDRINECLASIQEKENLITSLQQNFDAQASSLLQLQNEHRKITENVKVKDVELAEKAAKQKSLEEELVALQSQSVSCISEKEKKMLDLVKEIECLTNSLQEKEDQLVTVQNELGTSQAKIHELNEEVEQLSNEVQQASLNQTAANKESLEKLEVLQKEVNSLNQQKKQIEVDFEKKLEAFKTDVEIKEEEIQAKNFLITQHESQISLFTEKLDKIEEECSSLKGEIVALSEKHKLLGKEKENADRSLREKDESIIEFTKQVESLNALLDKTNQSLEERKNKMLSLQESMNVKEEENNQLQSKLQLSEQKVEMLNKDSSDHVIELQNELSKLKEETTTTKTHLEQELVAVKNVSETLSSTIDQKEKDLLEKEKLLTTLQHKLKEKESENSTLSTQNADLMKNISKFSSDIEEEQKIHKEKLTQLIIEYDNKLKEKEQELVAIKNVSETLLSTIDQKEKDLLEKEIFLTTLQNKLKEKESENSTLSTQNAELEKNISKFSSDIEKEQKMHKEKLTQLIIEYDNKLKEKEQAIQDIQRELHKHSQQLEMKAKELEDKESEIISLKNLVNEKNSQFDELSVMIESSQKQLYLLKEKNEKNEALLQSKENLINDFKTEQDKLLQLKEQCFKEESAKLSESIQNKVQEIQQKEAVTSNLMSEVEEQKKIIESLQLQLEIISAEKKKVAEDSSSIYQGLQNQVLELEEKYTKLLEEKDKIAKAESKTKEAQISLELVRDSLLQEKSAQEELVKDREAKLVALQAVVDRMQEEFTRHKQELQEKLDVSQMELDAVSELKHQLEVQHSVCEELQEGIQAGEIKCKELEAQVQIIPIINEKNNKLQALVDEFEKIDKDRCEKIVNLEMKYSTIEEQLNNNKNVLLVKDKELCALQEQLQKLQEDKLHSNGFNSSVKSLEEENKSLKIKMDLLELEKSEKCDSSAKLATANLSAEEAEEKESLLSQIDFLNSIIVDMKQKNEELTRQLEIQSTCWEESDVNLNETTKAIAPRLFCDICDMFDLHETCDCPKQESFLDEEAPLPQLKRPGTRKLEERPYCNNCEVFGHWTLDCDEPETF